jgi:D-alanyl-D-alanine carboxypeptidase
MKKQALDHSVKFIKSWLQFRYEHEEVPGFVVAISYKGKLLLNEAYGYADLESKTKLNADNIFRIASHSKTFTATALMQLQEQNKLRLDDYVVDHLSWLKQHKDKRWIKVTLRQLMSHGAGVIRDGVDADYWQLERPFPDENNLQKELLASELIIDGNTKLKYSNYGYSLLGMVIKKVSGIEYNEYVTKNIVAPLRLANTGPEYKVAIKDKLVTGYTRRDIDKTRLPIANVDTRAMASATGFYSTAQDLCTYFAAHAVGSKKLLDDESKKEMQRVHYRAKVPSQDNAEDYGLGLEIEYLKKRKTIGHGGGFPGHITKSLADSKDELVVVALTNCIDGPASSIVKGIYGIIDYFQENSSGTKPKHDMSKFEGRYMNLWGMTDIVVTGDKVIATYVNTWWPLSFPEELEYVNDTTLKVTDADSYSSEDELVHITFKNGGVETINYNGSTMWPERVWVNKLKKRKSIDLD